MVENNCGAAAMECWSATSILGVPICMTLGEMADEGMPISCETDINGAVTLAMLHAVTPVSYTHLYYLVDGAMHLREGEKEYSLKAGDVFLLQPGLVHEGTKPAGCAYYFVHFSNICILPFERETVRCV